MPTIYKLIFSITVFLTTYTFVHAQNGYIITNEDSVKIGYLKLSHSNEPSCPYNITLYLHKKDKNPIIYSLKSLKSYAYKKDTFLILKDYYVFGLQKYYKEVLILKQTMGGSIKLYETKDVIYSRFNFEIGPSPYYPTSSGSYNLEVTMFFISDNENSLVALDPDDFESDLNDFVDVPYCAQKLGYRKISYDNIPRMVSYQNWLNSKK